MSEPSWDILVGDCRDVLETLPDRSVHTVVTSPPYFGLRDYGTGEWVGGDPGCEHEAPKARQGATGERAGRTHTGLGGGRTVAPTCTRCGAERLDRQIGLEPAPSEFVEALVGVFRQVRRVLRDDGTVWLNLGDSYASKARGSDAGWSESRLTNPGTVQKAQAASLRSTGERHRGKGEGIKEKDLIGIPWMVAFALRADGWYLRSDVVWAKPNPMPESVTDRPTRAHEYLFLLTKSARYFYDNVAIQEPDGGRSSGNGFVRGERLSYQDEDGTSRGAEQEWTPGAGRNKRDMWIADEDEFMQFLAWRAAQRDERGDVWLVSTKPYVEAHFATFPPDLIEPCVLAGSPERACAACGAPWVRLVDRQRTFDGEPVEDAGAWAGPDDARRMNDGTGHYRWATVSTTLGFEPSCACEADITPGVVLDPFAGAATTGLAAIRAKREFVGIELSETFAHLGRERIETDIRLGHRPPRRAPAPADGQATLDLFAETATTD